MSFDVRQWIEKEIVEFDRVSPEKCGEKHTIFFRDCHRPLVSLLFESDSDWTASGCGWSTISGRSTVDSLLARIKKLSLSYSCTWFFAHLPQDEYTVVEFVGPRAKEWDEGLFFSFEHYEGTTRHLGLVIGDGLGVIMFTLGNIFEIAFYGPDSLWKTVHSHLFEEEK